MTNKSRWSKLLVLLAALALLLAACGEDEGPTTTGGNDQQAAAGELKLVEEGRLKVGSDIPYPPFEFNAKGGELAGFDVEVVRAVAERLGLENDDEDWITTDFGTIFEQLKGATRFDIVAAAVTGYAPSGSAAADTVAERVKVVDFTEPYYPSLQSLTVDAKKNPDIKSVDDLPKGARVGVQSATTGAFYAQENLGPKGIELVEFEKAPAMYQALLGGQLVGVFNDLPVSIDAIKDTPDLEVVEQVETGEEYAFAVAKDNPELKEAINDALAEIFEDGTYAEIFKKYFPEQELPDYASE